MKTLFLLFIILLAAIGLGFLIHNDPGYAMISYHHWMIATNLWVAIALFFLAFFILYFLMRMIVNIVAIPKMLARRRLYLNAQQYKKYMTLGISLLANGDHKQAEKCFLKLRKHNLISDEELNQMNTLNAN